MEKILLVLFFAWPVYSASPLSAQEAPQTQTADAPRDADLQRLLSLLQKPWTQ
jgi:hypothetical protein